MEATFSPGQLEDIADLSTEKQRLWRHRGILRPQVRGRAQFTAHELAGIVTLRYLELSPGGDLKALAVHANRVGAFVLGLALADPNAWIVQGFVETREAFEGFLKRKVEREGLCSIARALGLAKEEFGRFYVHSVAGWKITDDLPSAFESSNWAACVVIDLHAMSKLLVASVVKHSETPLYWVDAGSEDTDERATEPNTHWKKVVMRNVKSREPARQRAKR